MDPSSLPATTSTHHSPVHGANKYGQVGPDACGTVIAELMKNSGCSNAAAILCVDVFSDVGDWLIGFMNTRRNYTTSMFYFGICSSQVEQDWLQTHIWDELRAKYFAAELPLPGGAKLLVQHANNTNITVLTTPHKQHYKHQ